jgi:hypothetical protein
MFFSKESLKKVGKWCLPYGFYQLSGKLSRRYSFFENKSLDNLLSKNSEFKDVHKGQRGFVLGTGKSIRNQDLSFLKNETCLSLNLFYLHKLYSAIKPKYHIYSGHINHPSLSKELCLGFYKEIENNIGHSYFFTHRADFNFINTHGLFRKHKVIYVDYSKKLDLIFVDGVDLSVPTFYVANVAIQALLIAIYMGFKEIYLLGLDHDWIMEYIENESHYFYGVAEGVFNKRGTNKMYQIRDFEWILQMSAQIWNQYKKIKRFCDSKGIKIYNATAGGLLDVFPRVEYESIIK